MTLYFLAKRYKNKGPLDIDWNPLTFPEANEKIEKYKKTRDDLKDSVYGGIHYTYFILEVNCVKMLNEQNEILEP